MSNVPEASNTVSAMPVPPGIEPVVLTELTVGELYARTGPIDPETGLQMTRFDELRQQEATTHGGRIITHIGEYLSKGAQEINKDLRTKRVRASIAAGATVMVVIALRKIKEQRS